MKKYLISLIFLSLSSIYSMEKHGPRGFINKLRTFQSASFFTKKDKFVTLYNEYLYDVNKCLDIDFLPIHITAAFGDKQLLELRLPIDGIECRTSDGATPLHCAVIANNIENIEALLSKNASVSSQTNSGKTPLMYAIQNSDIKTIDLLLRYGANPLIKDNKNNSILHYIAQKDDLGLLHYVFTKIPYLKEDTKLLDDTNSSQQTPLFIAVLYNSINIAKELIRYGADIYTTDNDKNTLLHIAASENNPFLLEYLLKQNKIYIEEINSNADTPLNLAADLGAIKTIKILLKHNASVYTRNNYGICPLESALVNTQMAAMKILLTSNKTYTQNFIDHLYTVVDQAEFSLENLTEADIYNDKLNLLITLLRYSHIAPTKLNEILRNYFVDSAPEYIDLISAIIKGTLNEEMLCSLLESLKKQYANLDYRYWLNSKEIADMSSLMWAAAYGRTDTIELLLKYGAQLSVENYQGKYACPELEIAYKKGHKLTVAYLYKKLQPYLEMAKAALSKHIVESNMLYKDNKNNPGPEFPLEITTAIILQAYGKKLLNIEHSLNESTINKPTSPSEEN